MKKTFVWILAALTALVSCDKEMINTPATHGPATEITFNLTATHPGGDGTKAVKTGWETGDVIFVFFREFAAPKYLKLSYDGTGWAGTQMNAAAREALGLTNGQELHMRAVYLPFGSRLGVAADASGRFVFSETRLSYYLTATLTCTVADNMVSGNFDMKVPEGYVQFFVEDIYVGDAMVELRESHLTPQGVASVAADGSIVHKTLSHGAPLPGYVYDKENKPVGEYKGVLFSGILAPEVRNVPADYHFTYVVKNEENDWTRYLYFSKSYADKTLYRASREGRALKLPLIGGNWTRITDYLPIDLGCDVPTGVGEDKRRIYWSSRNLGASSDFPAADTDAARKATWGDYYARGATEPYYVAGHAYDDPCTDWKTGKTGYTWLSYPFMKGGPPWDSYIFINKYTFEDGQTDGVWYTDGFDDKTVLEPADDAAFQALGGPWRMPEAAEWMALFDDTRFDMARDEANRGLKVTSKVPGFEGCYIFLPAAGCREHKTLSSAGEKGFYWSSTLYDFTDFAIDMNFDMVADKKVVNSAGRRYGRSIRPVTE